jgi:LuxR family quorum sensing-dependent transcriptional regulator
MHDLSTTFVNAIEPLGMTAAASGMVTGPRGLSDNPFHFVTWPSGWLETYAARGFRAIDPIPRWAMVSGEAISWTELVKVYPPSDLGMEVPRAAMQFDFHEGYVTPVRTRRGALGLVSVGGGRRPGFELSEELFLQAASTAALLRAEALIAGPPVERQDFTLRERECVALLRQGFTDAEISKVLRIALATTRSHLENARRKVGARNRVELARH